MKVRDRILDVCSHGECRSNKIWDFPTCWHHLTDAEKQKLRERLADALRSKVDLRGIILTNAELDHFDFTGADLSKAFFNGSDLHGCKFIDANLRGAFFGGATLKGADLTRAELDRAVFTGANLEDVFLLGYSIRLGRVPINLTMECFGRQGLFKRPHIDESEPPFAQHTYRALKTYFLNDGDYDSASWASYCERLMQRKHSWTQKNYVNWAISLVFSAACGYGEKPRRVFGISIGIILLYALLYYGLHLINPAGPPRSATLWESVYFSALTFTGVTFSEFLPATNAIARVLVTTESFGGIFALSLFVFTLTKRYVAR